MAEPVRICVLDLSHHETVVDIDAIREEGIIGVIHKATEGTSYVDPTYAERKAAFIDAGFLWGAYHFVHPNNIEAQVDHFLKTAGIDDTTLYALDWEESSSGTMDEGEAEEFMYLLETMTGRKGVIYSGHIAKETIEGVNEYLGSHRLWLAQYGPTPTVQESWNTYWLWQTSETGDIPGIPDEVDINSYAGTDDELRSEWSGTGRAIAEREPRYHPGIVAVRIYAPRDVEVKVDIKQSR
jgi:lysozyme